MSILLSIVIPTYKRQASLARLLSALQEQSIRDQIEIIVVDQNEDGYLSQYMTQEQVHNIRFLRDVRPNVSLARNEGLNVAESDWVLFMDDDLVPEREFCELMLNSLSTNEMSCLAPLVYDERGKEHAHNELLLKPRVQNQAQDLIIVDDVISACFIITKELYNKIGGFDVQLFDFVRCTEDKDFFNRLNEVGKRVFVDRTIPLYHAEEIEGGCELRKDEYWQQRHKFMKGWVYMVFKSNNELRTTLKQRWKLYRSAFINRHAFSEGLSHILKSYKTLINAYNETREFCMKNNLFRSLS